MSLKTSLPIDGYKGEILELIRSSDVIIISSSTGSGKSTRIPQFILEDNLDVHVIVSQPRRLATQKVAERVALEMGQTVGELVGYQISMDCKSSKDTRLTFMTTGILGAILSKNGQEIKDITHIIVDEVHGCDIHTDLVLLQIKLLQQKMDNFNPKIILLSATMNHEKFQSYFNHKSVNCLIIPGQVKQFSLQKCFIDDLERGLVGRIGNRILMVNGLEDIYVGLDSCIVNPNYEKIPTLIDQLDKLEEYGIMGAVLIFLPGIGEITDVGESLKKFAILHHMEWVILEMHSNMTDEERLRLFQPVKWNERKIVLATNIAESSITIIDIVYVIDMCLTKIMSHNTLSGFSSLATILVSKHQAEQRAGRAGRTCPGICFRLVTRRFYDIVIQVESASEMQKAGLDMAFLYVKNLKMGHPRKLLLEAINPPDVMSILSAVHSLKKCGALIDSKDRSHDNGDMTVIGLLAVNLACDPKLARLIAFGKLFGFLNESIVIAMCLASKPLFATSTAIGAGVRAFLDKIEIGGGLHSDSLAFVGAYNLYINKKRNNPEFWASDMKKQYIKSNVIRNIEYTVIRAIQKMNRYMNIYANGELKSVDDFVNSKQLASEFKLFMAAASWPNIFVHRCLTNHENHVATVMKEIQGYKPTDTVVLEPMNGQYLTYQPYQLADLKKQLTLQECPVIPNVTSNGKFILVNYDVNDYQRVGAMADPVLEGMKTKAQNHFFHLIQENSLEKPIKLLGPRSPIAINFHSTFEYCCGAKVTRDRDSVNFLAFDEQFPKPTTYTMCSMIVANGKYNLVAKESTIMEPEDGTFELINLIFSPQVKIATKEGKVVGFIAGLGPIPKNTDGFVPPKHDHLITLDFLMDTTGIENINIIRSKINNLLDIQSFLRSDNFVEDSKQLLKTDILNFFSDTKERVNNNRITSCTWGDDYETGLMLMPIKIFDTPEHNYSW